MRVKALSLLLALLMVVGLSGVAFAQDNSYEMNEMQNYAAPAPVDNNSAQLDNYYSGQVQNTPQEEINYNPYYSGQVQNTPQEKINYNTTSYELNLSVGLGYFTPIFMGVDLAFQIRLSSFYRIGLEEKFGGMANQFETHTALTNEFDLYRGPLFTFSMRIGVGYYYTFGERNIWLDDDEDYQKFLGSLTIPAGFGFDWRLSKMLSLKFQADFGNYVMFYRRTQDEYNSITNRYIRKKDVVASFLPLPEFSILAVVHF